MVKLIVLYAYLKDIFSLPCVFFTVKHKFYHDLTVKRGVLWLIGSFFDDFRRFPVNRNSLEKTTWMREYVCLIFLGLKQMKGCKAIPDIFLFEIDFFAENE